MKKLIILLSVVILTLLLMCSCGSSSDRSDYDQTPNAPNYDQESGSVDKSEIYGEKVIKNAFVSAETKDYDNATDSLEALIKQHGGHIYSSDSTVQASYYNTEQMLRSANYTIKIPVESFDAFLDGLKDVLHITRMNTSTADASEEYYDLEAIITTYEAKREGLVAILENTDKTTDLYTWQQINKELTQLDIDIARYKAQLIALQNKVNYSTVTLNVTEVGELTITDEIGFGQELLDAITDSLQGTLEFFQGLLIVLIYMLPFNIVGAVVAIIIVLSVRKGRKKRAAARAAAHQQSQTPPPQYFNPNNQ